MNRQIQGGGSDNKGRRNGQSERKQLVQPSRLRTDKTEGEIARPQAQDKGSFRRSRRTGLRVGQKVPSPEKK